MNPQVVRLREWGGNLVVTIPRQLLRELGFGARDYLQIARSGPGALTITRAEVHRRDAPHVSESAV
jgi:antitoxin component of MazEF toxin-antitoxin module